MNSGICSTLNAAVIGGSVTPGKLGFRRGYVWWWLLKYWVGWLVEDRILDCLGVNLVNYCLVLVWWGDSVC